MFYEIGMENNKSRRDPPIRYGGRKLVSTINKNMVVFKKTYTACVIVIISPSTKDHISTQKGQSLPKAKNNIYKDRIHKIKVLNKPA